MFTSLAVAAGPAFRSAGRYLAPVVREAARDAVKHATEAVILYSGTITGAASGVGLYIGGRRVMRLAASLPCPRVRVTTWKPSWETARSIPEAAPHSPSIDGVAEPVAPHESDDAGDEPVPA